MSTFTYYAFARHVDPTQGAFVYDATMTFQPAAYPALEIVCRWLATQKGDCKADPNLGVDWQGINLLGTNAQADANSVLSTAMNVLVTRGTIAKMTSGVQIDDSPAGRIVAIVSFTDPRTGQQWTAKQSVIL